jgi:hypothetical protein
MLIRKVKTLEHTIKIKHKLRKKKSSLEIHDLMIT